MFVGNVWCPLWGAFWSLRVNSVTTLPKTTSRACSCEKKASAERLNKFNYVKFWKTYFFYKSLTCHFQHYALKIMIYYVYAWGSLLHGSYCYTPLCWSAALIFLKNKNSIIKKKIAMCSDRGQVMASVLNYLYRKCLLKWPGSSDLMRTRGDCRKHSPSDEPPNRGYGHIISSWKAVSATNFSSSWLRCALVSLSLGHYLVRSHTSKIPSPATHTGRLLTFCLLSNCANFKWSTMTEKVSQRSL